MSLTYESIACPACGGTRHNTFLNVDDRFQVEPGRLYSIVECAECRLLFLNPRPDADSIAAFYATEEYDPFGSNSEAKSLSSRLYRLARPLSIRRKASRVVQNLKSGSKTLDVGCATGEFMLELKRRGFQAYGVEPDPRAAEYARDKFGLNVRQGGIEQASAETGPYALITFWHVLEHVHRLRDNLTIAHRLLAENGRLSIAVPNPASWDAQVYGRNWVAWDAPRHLYHFRPKVMMELLMRSGFRPVRAGAIAFDAFYHCVLSEQGGAMRLMRGGWRGSISFLRSILGLNGSSELYFAYKQ
ncbi:class I SAM-dependent methyltransferase [bacterium]|nr:class I SAM-dependent methyltransferase [bacterium]